MHTSDKNYFIFILWGKLNSLKQIIIYITKMKHLPKKKKKQDKIVLLIQ